MEKDLLPVKPFQETLFKNMYGLLTPDEQEIYDEAYAMSEEKPCCCKCWHYFTNDGITKKMIKDGQYNSKEIADYWDNSDICGA